MNDREKRLRERIDRLTDERDQARERAQLVPALRKRINAITRSRDMWRDRWLERGIHGRWRKH